MSDDNGDSYDDKKQKEGASAVSELTDGHVNSIKTGCSKWLRGKT